MHTNWWLLLLNNFFFLNQHFCSFIPIRATVNTPFSLFFFLSSLYLNLTLFLLQISHQLVCCSVHTSIRNTNFLTVSGFNNYVDQKYKRYADHIIVYFTYIKIDMSTYQWAGGYCFSIVTPSSDSDANVRCGNFYLSVSICRYWETYLSVRVWVRLSRYLLDFIMHTNALVDKEKKMRGIAIFLVYFSPNKNKT